MNKQVEELTDNELKSIGYETLIALEQNKMNLQIVQTELTKRANAVVIESDNKQILKKK